MSGISKRYAKAIEGLDLENLYPLSEAVKIIKDRSSVKFDETVEISINLGVDSNKSDQVVRGVVDLPKGTGKTLKVAVFARDKKAKEAKDAGADIVGAEDLAVNIEKGEVDFDRVVATPDMMAVVGKLGKVLGPRGLMPNPKLGSVTLELDKAIKSIKAGQVEFKAEKAGIIHAGLGKVSFGEKDILENISSFIDSVQKARPSGAKGQFIKKINIASVKNYGRYGFDPSLIVPTSPYNPNKMWKRVVQIIGKMKNPTYFTENQTTSVNPHNDLEPQESANVIIDHVLDGIEIAKKNKLPDRIIDFIRTHHGTSSVYYFYMQEKKF